LIEAPGETIKMPAPEASTVPHAARDCRDGLIVIDDFLPPRIAAALRDDLENHFHEPQAHRAETHQVWNYWFVPGLYTYLRTAPEKLIAAERVRGFVEALRARSMSTLGLAGVTWPFLSLYVDGCRQRLHNDSRNGRFGFVYSLTADSRRSVGGETLVMYSGDALRGNLANPAAGESFYETIAPRFNRLILFDDRLPHAVSPVEGSMDPLDGRLVLHGHIREAGPLVNGALSPAAVARPIATLLQTTAIHAGARLSLYHGFLSLRFSVEPSGSVGQCDVLADRVLHRDAGNIEWEPLRQELVDRVAELTFPRAAGRTMIVLPMTFGEPLTEIE
jgi:Rps23 Pro-64 3,4-dihydroxylase Tpa1-like proline 4-hydroxylase